jgi:hypothetical protein
MPITITITAETGLEAADTMWQLLNGGATTAILNAKTTLGAVLGSAEENTGVALGEQAPVSADVEVKPKQKRSRSKPENVTPVNPAIALAEEANAGKPAPEKPGDTNGAGFFEEDAEAVAVGVETVVLETPVDLKEQAYKAAEAVALKHGPNAVLYLKQKHQFKKIAEASPAIQAAVLSDLQTYLQQETLPAEVKAFLATQQKGQ